MSDSPTNTQVSDGEKRSLRTLSKSDFTLARSCEAKLFFRENRYLDNRESDPYLAMLAEGGYMVEALAKAKYPAGIQLEYGQDVTADAARTLEYLRRDTVTLFEATLLVGGKQARVDILEKKGDVVRLLEIKAKSFDGAEHAASLADGKKGALRGKKKPYDVLAPWMEKLDDITFQVLLLELMLPGARIHPHLVLVDKSKEAGIDNVPGLFELVRFSSPERAGRLQTARYLGTPEQLTHLDLVTEVNVSEEVSLRKSEVKELADRLESLIDAPLAHYSPFVQRGSKCGKCQFRNEANLEKNGFNECWGALATPKPHMLELFSIGTAKAPDRSSLAEWMIKQGKSSLLDIPEEGLTTADGSIGATAERQRRQIEYTRLGKTFLSTSLRGKIERLRGPMHFIDFETSRLALPYHRGMRPYGNVVFQWSSHRIDAFGGEPVHSEWLNNTDIWPNQRFAESLRASIGDEGPVITWSHFEESTLKDIIRDLARFGHNAPELVAWMTDVFQRRIVDLHEWARSDYYQPEMRGRTSIKVVLEAIWKSDDAMRAQFETWTKLRADASRDPYSSLPSVKINGVEQDVHEGTGAMRAYQEMMYGPDRSDTTVRDQWSALLKQYCALDTLSMVLILDHWRRCVGQG